LASKTAQHLLLSYTYFTAGEHQPPSSKQSLQIPSCPWLS